MKIIAALFCALLLLACEKNEISSTCEPLTEPMTGLEVVKEEIATYTCLTEVYAGMYKDQTVYITSVIDPACITDGSVGIFDTSGEFIGNVKPGSDLKMGDLLTNNRE